MKITVFNGAMRGRKSITNMMVQAFLQGAGQAGADVEDVILVEKKINHCLGCLKCWIKTPGKCIQKDDMAELIEKYMASDLVLIASPLYVDNVTGLTKDFIDRLVPISDPHFELDENGESRHRNTAENYPGIMVMSNCGYPEQSSFQVVRLLFRRIARNLNGRFVAEIYRGCGGIFGVKDPAVAPIVNEYLELLGKAGAEIARDMKLSEQTIAALEQQLVPTDVYNAQVNMFWDSLMSGAGNSRTKDSNGPDERD